MARVHLIRHGQASFGADNYDALSAKGHDQASHLAKAVSLPDRLVSGTMQRHRETAAPFGPVNTDAGWNEFDYLDVLAAYRPELNSPAALRAAFADAPNPKRAFQDVYDKATTRWADGAHDGDYVESRSAFRERVRDAMTTLVAELGKDDTAYVVTSGGPIVAIVQDVLGLTEHATRAMEHVLVNCGVTTLSVRPGHARLISLNEQQHLGAIDANLITFR
ncbi:histidine phosphatase family protein (plasmid) [Rhodobacteraceae bacterium S2214]|nr:histidine phosphatase family protein [Rhodobacteraceae bacterium S2214]